MEELPAFILAAVALAWSPGPGTFSLAATGAAFGRRGLAYMFGIDAGMVIVMAVTAAGVTGVVLALPGAKPVAAVLAVAYFLYLAWRIATAPPLAELSEHREPSFTAGVFLSLVNPKAYAAMTALFSGFVLVRMRADLDAGVKLAVLVVIVMGANFAWLFAGAALTRHFRDPRTSRIINVAFAILLVASVGAAFLL